MPKHLTEYTDRTDAMGIPEVIPIPENIKIEAHCPECGGVGVQIVFRRHASWAEGNLVCQTCDHEQVLFSINLD